MADNGEGVTSERKVNAMLDLVKQETERIESRFLDMFMLGLIQFNYNRRPLSIAG